MRDGDWKLLLNPRDTSKKGELGPDDRVYLVNLSEDLGEAKNVAKQHPEVVERLQAKITEIQSGLE